MYEKNCGMGIIKEGVLTEAGSIIRTLLRYLLLVHTHTHAVSQFSAASGTSFGSLEVRNDC